MKPLRVLFIEPVGGITNVFENYMRLPLLGSLYLGTILKQHGHHVRVVNENILGERVDPFAWPADVYCITALTVTASRAHELAGHLKRIHPESRVMVGGIHASLLPGEFTDVADHVVIGEAEGLIVDLVEGRIEEQVVHGSPVADVNELPLLDYSLLEGYRTMDIVPLMTSRGCPFDCNFCTVTKIFGRKFRMFSPERVVAEIENALEYFTTPHFFFYDDNFSANRRRVSEVCDLMREKGIEISWTAQVRSDLAKDPELVEKMYTAGCRLVYIGFESIEDETLAALHKSQTRADIEHAIRVLHSFGLRIHGMFMFGEDHDTIPTIGKTVDFAIANAIDTVQFMILTPFPGTQVYDRLAGEGRLLHTDWDYYNGMFITFEPTNMPAITLQEETYRAYQRFYSLGRTVGDIVEATSNLFLDALVWNFCRARNYGFEAKFMRGAAKAIIDRAGDISRGYCDFLRERRKSQRVG